MLQYRKLVLYTKQLDAISIHWTLKRYSSQVQTPRHITSKAAAVGSDQSTSKKPFLASQNWNTTTEYNDHFGDYVTV